MGFFTRRKIKEKEYQEQLKKYQEELASCKERLSELSITCQQAMNRVEFFEKQYPLTLGQVVYDIQLRGQNGRYTRTKASREHSLITELTVDTKNYFKLVDRLNTDVFTSFEAANEYLDSICIC